MTVTGNFFYAYVGNPNLFHSYAGFFYAGSRHGAAYFPNCVPALKAGQQREMVEVPHG